MIRNPEHADDVREAVAARRGLPLDEVAPAAMLRAQAAGRAEAAEKAKAGA